jgi:hypothetical protein
MRFMILVKASKDSEAGAMPSQEMFTTMTDYHEQLKKAGVLLDANGLRPSSKGFRIEYAGGKRTVVDGPFSETKELIAGYTMIQVKSREEAVEWAKRFPKPHDVDCHIEVRQMFDIDEFGEYEAIGRWRDIAVGPAK